MTTAQTKTESAKEFKPVTFWLANPSLQLKIRIPGTSKYLQFHSGKLVAKTQAEYDLIVKNGMAYEDDGFKPKKGYESTGYAPGSSEAFQEHMNFIPQG